MGNRTVQNNMTTNEKTPAAATPLPVNYATLEADVAEYIADLLESTRYQYGETDAEADARIAAEKEKFRLAPWAALLWYVEHMAPQAQLDLVNAPDPEAAPEDELNPEYRVVEIDGKNVLAGNVDAGLKLVMEMDTPEASEFLGFYQSALDELKALNGTPSTEAMRQEAFQMARGACGVHIEPVGATQ